MKLANFFRSKSRKIKKSETYTKLVFIHLTKTAGGTLKSEIGRQNKINPIFIYNEEDWRDYDNDSHNVIYGHPDNWLFGNIGKPLPRVEGNIRYIAFLRDPVARTISHYYHLRNVDDGPAGDQIRTFPDINVFFAESYHWEFENYFCRIFSNYTDILSRENMDEKFYSAIDVVCNKMFFVGFQEFFEQSLLCLNKKTGLELAPKKNANIGKYSLLDVTPKTLETIERLNYFDIKLYNHVLSGFLKK